MRSLYKIITIFLLITPFTFGYYEQRRSLYRRESLPWEIESRDPAALDNMFGGSKQKNKEKPKSQKQIDKEDKYSKQNLKKQCVGCSAALIPFRDTDLYARPVLDTATSQATNA